MKKLIVLLIALMALTMLGATELQHWTGSIDTYFILPDLDAPAVPRVAVIFEPTGPCVFNSVLMRFYQAGSQGQPQVMAELRPVDAAGNIDESGFAPPSVLKQYSEISWFPSATLFDFAGIPEANRTFAGGEKFAIVLSVPNATANINVGVLGVGGDIGNSYTYIDTYGWYRNDDVFTNPMSYAFTADVTYTGNFLDLEATSLYFTGDMFLQPGDAILYEADVTSNSNIPVTGDVKIEVLDQATGTALWTQTWANQSFPVSADSVHFTCTAPPVVAYPTTAGDYQVKLTVTLAGDMDNTNNMLELEQITFSPPGNMDYSDDLDTDEPDNSYAWYNGGSEIGVDFWYYAAPLTLQSVGFRINDSSWPSGAATNPNLKYAIYNWVDGLPNQLYVTPDPVPCTLGQWNYYDVSALGLNFAAGESFMVAYKQVGDYPNCPSLCTDESAPLSGWISSYYWNPTDQTWYLGEDSDLMIRAGVIETVTGVEAPIISIALDSGYPTITWDEVTGAQSYNVYGSNDPYAAQPWTAIVTGINDLGYAYQGTEPYQFFYVTASTEADGSKMANTELVPTVNANAISRKIKATDVRAEVTRVHKLPVANTRK